MYMNHKEVVHVVLKRILFGSLISQEITESFPMRKNVIHWQDKVFLIPCLRQDSKNKEIFSNEDTVTQGQF